MRSSLACKGIAKHKCLATDERPGHGPASRQLPRDSIAHAEGFLYALMMALTRDFKETILARVARDPAFRESLLKEGVECLLSGDVETGKTVLRDYINATIAPAK